MSDQYRVIGGSTVAGASNGETVELDGEKVNIPALVEAGHVELVENKKSAANKSTTKKSEGGSGDASVQHDGRDDSGS